jgi:hypothetical protein
VDYPANQNGGQLSPAPFSLDRQGRPQFEDLMFRRGELFFVAFDALYRDSKDLRRLPLVRAEVHLRGSRSLTPE